MRNTVAACLTAGLLLSFSTAAVARDPAPAAIEDAWQAYRFQSYDSAAATFRRAATSAPDPATRQQAEFGLALVAQFREQNPNPADAIRRYQALLDSGITGELRWQVLSFLAECHAAQNDLTRANAAWDQVITGATNSLVAQDALLRRTVANLGALDSPRTADAIAYLERHRAAFPAPTPATPGLAPAFDLLLGNVYYWRRDYSRARDAFMRYVAVGTRETTSYTQQATAMMRIARISEDLLDDPATAGTYYRMLVERTPNDTRSFFALERAVRHGAITADEIRALKLYGISEAIIRELFTAQTAP